MSHAEIAAFFVALKAARPGVRVGLYESLSGFDQGLGQDFNWVAAWVSNPPPIPWTFWQYTSSGGTLDLDHFNGTQAQLLELAGIHAPAPHPVPPPLKVFVAVHSGNTLGGIAHAHGITTAKLLSFAENARYRSHPNLIHPGDRVRVR
jgi:hypothetical protein